MPKEKSCGAVVFRKDREIEYLLLQYEAGHWDLVKGHGKRGERETETVLRELEEETGIVDAWFIPEFREEIHYFFRRRGSTVYKEVVYYLMETRKREVLLSDEHIGYQWLPFERAIRTITFKNSRDVVKKAQRHLKAEVPPGG
ncbi:diadenosine tetraphosphate hydrolase [Methanoculleus taiwanensis]|uniref:Bis(5'-nucleosyl)-tetraphosphatase [asymmetrical] n=1 Tax=Methanoculleus taiwanensis TaxID=1550565 RepID=A0A498GY26_9EURY|nr:NUDIX domain-containing protein [Methanoculleus taiwanensis]RXE55629.1 diadenosine tetraphosphate hydrolase [Methanoculleus taiwanensis]